MPDDFVAGVVGRMVNANRQRSRLFVRLQIRLCLKERPDQLRASSRRDIDSRATCTNVVSAR